MITEIQILTCLAFLTYASVSDLHTRHVSNDVWIAMSAFGVLNFYYIGTGTLDPTAWLYVVASGFILSIILFYTNQFGGADAKALISLAVVLPLFPGTELALENIVWLWTLFYGGIISIIMIPLFKHIQKFKGNPLEIRIPFIAPLFFGFVFSLSLALLGGRPYP